MRVYVHERTRPGNRVLMSFGLTNIYGCAGASAFADQMCARTLLFQIEFNESIIGENLRDTLHVI